MQRGQKRANGIDDEPIPGPNEDPPTTTSHIYCNSLDNDDPNGLSPLSSPKRKRARHEGNPSGASSSPPRLFTEEEELANSLVMLSSARLQPILEENPPNMFECKTCKKVFPSHQALGGHRASHKKVKGCYAARLQIESFDVKNAPMEENYNQVGSLWENKSLAVVPLTEKLSPPLIKNKSQFHECSVCERRFATGQALGGHMRCHWNKSKTDINGATATRNNRSDYTIDLNKPAPMEDIAEIPLLVDVPATLYLLPGLNVENETKELENAVNENFEDEAQSRLAELDKLSHLKDFNDGEESSTWLRIGIGPN